MRDDTADCGDMTHVLRHTRMYFRAALCAAVLLCLAGQQAGAQYIPGYERKNKEPEKPESSQQEFPLTAVEVAVNDSTYVVGPTDQLNFSIFADRFYSYDVVVSSNGWIVIPLVGEVYVKDKTLAQVAALSRRSIDGVFRNAQLTVSLIRARQIKVSVTGAVKTPGVVTLPATARVSEALLLAGGIVRDTTALRGITVHRGNQVLRADLKAYLRNAETAGNPFLMGGDIVHFPRIDQRVGVFGAVNYEGHIDFQEGDRLYDYLRLAGGLRSSVYLDSVQIVRFKPDNQNTETFYLNITGYPENQESNIVMKASDLVLVRAVPKYQYHRLVVVRGEVMYPGTYSIVRGSTRLTDLIRKAGGFTPDASLEEASVTRARDENERDMEYERLEKINPADMREDEYEYFKARSRERVGQMVVDFKRLFLEGAQEEDIILQDKDVIEVPVLKNFVRVIGRVNNPGNIIFRRGWNFLQYIDACGGYGWRADDGDVRVVKARTGELVDAEDVGSYALEPGDTIWVPEVPKTKFWEAAFTALGILSQIAGIVGIVIALSNVSR